MNMPPPPNLDDDDVVLDDFIIEEYEAELPPVPGRAAARAAKRAALAGTPHRSLPRKIVRGSLFVLLGFTGLIGLVMGGQALVKLGLIGKRSRFARFRFAG
jgi:hypothetical protein